MKQIKDIHIVNKNQLALSTYYVLDSRTLYALYNCHVDIYI